MKTENGVVYNLFIIILINKLSSPSNTLSHSSLLSNIDDFSTFSSDSKCAAFYIGGNFLPWQSNELLTLSTHSEPHYSTSYRKANSSNKIEDPLPITYGGVAIPRLVAKG